MYSGADAVLGKDWSPEALENHGKAYSLHGRRWRHLSRCVPTSSSSQTQLFACTLRDTREQEMGPPCAVSGSGAALIIICSIEAIRRLADIYTGLMSCNQGRSFFHIISTSASFR